MRAHWGLAIVAIAGCKAAAPDPCAKIAGTCINLTVTSQQIATIDTILVSAGDPISASTSSSLGHAGRLPAHLALTIPAAVSGTIHFDLSGVLNSDVLGVGQFDATLTPNAHLSATAEIEPSALTGGDGGADLAGASDMPSAGPVAARLIAPLSTSTVTNHRPHVRWELPPGATNPQLDFCTTRTCTQTIGATTIDPAGTSGSPTSDLPTGIVFWRVRTSNPDGTATSATWEFSVLKRVQQTESVDSSGGTFLDVNGDGRGDVAGGAQRVVIGGVSGVGRVYVFHSTGAGIASTAATLDGAGGMNSYFGARVASAGDVNGDGYGDLLVTNANNDAFIFPGGPNGIISNAVPSTLVTGIVMNESISPAGDVNGDGYADLVVGTPQASTPGQAYLLLGGPQGLSKVPSWNVDGSDAQMGSTSPQFGVSVSAAGDVNGDGYSDIVIGAPDQAHSGTSNTGNVYVYLGGPSKLTAFAKPPISDVSLSSYGFIVRGANDLDGDGYDDILVAAASQTVEAVLGGPATFKLGPKLTDSQSGSGFASQDYTIGAVGDVNGDGLADVAIGAPSAFPMSGPGVPGAVSWYVATMNGGTFDLLPQGTVYGPDGDNSAFAIVTGAGDVDGDGRADVLVGAPCAPTSSGSCGPGTAYLFKGTLGGFPTVADQKWVGPETLGGFGTVAVRGSQRLTGRGRRHL